MGSERKSSPYALFLAFTKPVTDLISQAAQRVIEALGSALPKTEFIPLLAGWEEFNKNGKALPDETVR